MAEQEPFWIQTEDWHTAGEPFRIVSELPPHCSTTGNTVWDRRLNIIHQKDHPLDLLRKCLCHEPRGHADMYGGFIVPPNDSAAHFGVLFWNRDNFSTACGHGSIALARWATARGIVQPVQDGVVKVIIDVPSGRVTTDVTFSNGKPIHVDFINVASYQFAKDIAVCVSLDGQADAISLKANLSWSGASFASVDISPLPFDIQPRHSKVFINLFHQIKKQIGHRGDHAGTSLYSVCFYDTLDDNEDTITQKNVVVYAEGAIDRSPCGSGTGSRVAVLLAQGKLNEHKKLVHRSIIDTVFEASIVSQQQGEGVEYPTCVPKVRGNASLTGRHSFFIDPNDSTYPGFFFA
jgi:trans-L-3-hydroxyproline dehydratase